MNHEMPSLAATESALLKQLLEQLRPIGFMPYIFEIENTSAYQALLQLEASVRQQVIGFVLDLLAAAPSAAHPLYADSVDRDIYGVFLKVFMEQPHYFPIQTIAPVFQRMLAFYGNYAWIHRAMLFQYTHTKKQHSEALDAYSIDYLEELLQQHMLADTLEGTLELRAAVTALLGADPQFIFTALDPQDRWMSYIQRFVQEQPDSAAWYPLLLQWMQATTTKPSILWVLQTQRLLKALEWSAVLQLIETVLEIIADEHAPVDGKYLISPYNLTFIKGLLWTLTFDASAKAITYVRTFVERSSLVQPSLVYTGIYALLQTKYPAGRHEFAQLLQQTTHAAQKRIFLGIARANGWKEE